MLTTRKLSDAHEDWLVDLLGGRKTKGSGNQWHNQCDGRMSSRSQYYAFAWDGKATLGKSLSISRDTWAKVVEQALPEAPLLPLRWYATERLDVALDLVALDAATFAEILSDANRWQAAREQGCLTGNHRPDPLNHVYDCTVCGADLTQEA